MFAEYGGKILVVGMAMAQGAIIGWVCKKIKAGYWSDRQKIGGMI